MRVRSRFRRAAAAVELAILLPFLMFMFVIAVDWSRVFYDSVIVTNCARNGALYACDPTTQANSPYHNVTEAALADASNLSPQPTVDPPTFGKDANGSDYVEVTVTHQFQTVTNFPGVPKTTTLVRTVRMNVLPQQPN